MFAESFLRELLSQLRLKLRRNLWILATIGSITPFVGLFGTVAGIMRSFKDLGLDVEAGGTETTTEPLRRDETVNGAQQGGRGRAGVLS